MKRTYGKVGVVALAAAMLVALIGTSVASAGPKAAHSTFGVNATGTVHFWVRDATSQAAAVLVPEFNRTHKNLKIVLTKTSPNDDTSSLASSIRAGDPPDLVGLNDIDVPEFMYEHALLNITKYVNALPYKSALSPGHLALATVGTQYYGVPYLSDLSVLWYNKKLFKEAGIASPPTTYAEIASDAKAITALSTASKPIYGLSFAGDCQGCLGFVMLPDIWASGQHLITGALGHQKANITNNAPLKALLSVYAQIWKNKEAPADSQTQNGTTWGQDFGKGNIGMLPGDYGFFSTYLKEGLPASEFADVPLPSENGGHGSTFDGGDDFVIPAGAKNPSGAWEVVQWFLAKAQQLQYAPNGESPVRTDIVTPSFEAKYPYDAVALNTLKYGSVEYTLAYDQVFNEPASPWLKMFDEAVYSDNVSNALSIGQSGIQATLNSVTS
ncbi:MAG: extracellular solute-binding protein [Acidimicrobiales bacterium]|jgi:multiple sugar transport system substrate-binding protein